MGCSGIFWDILRCSGMFLDALGCSGLNWDVLGFTGVSITSVLGIGSTKFRVDLDKV